MKYCIAAVFIIAISVAKAQRPLSLGEAVALSLQNNYDILLSRNDSALAALDESYAGYAFLPQLNAAGGINFNNNNSRVILLDGTERERKGIRSENLNASVNLNWTLFDGMRMFITRRRLGEMVEMGELQIKAQVVNTVAEVMRLYYDIARQQQQIQATEEQMALSQERLELSQYKLDVGTGTRSDVLQAQIDYNGHRSQLLLQQAAARKLYDQLHLMMLYPPEQEFIVADTIPVNISLTMDSVQGGLPANPVLLLGQKQMDIAELIIRERKAERWPVVSFNSAYNFNRTDNRDVINPVSPLFIQNRGLNYGLTATIPLFNGFNARRNIRAAQLDFEFLDLQYRRNLAVINTSAITAFRDYELFRETLLLEEDNISLVREYLFIARERYRIGVATFLEMRTAEQNLADAMNRLIQARFNIKQAEIELMRLQGTLVQ